MLAVVESLGIVLSGGVVSAFRLRLGFVALFAGSTWLMARLTDAVLRASGGLPRGLRPERDGLPQRGGGRRSRFPTGRSSSSGS